MARVFTKAEQVDMLLIYGECIYNKRRAKEVYAQRYPDRQQPSQSYFPWLVDYFKRLPGNDDEEHRFIISEESEVNVLACVNLNHSVSVRQIEVLTGVNRESARQILKKHGYKSFKYQIHQHLGVNDFNRRLVFCNWFMNNFANNNNFNRLILFSDESRFTNLGMFNRNNTRYWATENQHLFREGAFQERFGVNVWLGVLGTRIVGPIFFQASLDAEQYLQFLENEIENFMQNLPLAEARNVMFQQDGAPAHNARVVVQFLNNTYGANWIGTNGPVRWPARSPDLTPLDFFYWPHIKEKVYASPPENLDDLRERITVAINNISIEQRENVLRKIVEKYDLCIQQNGGHFEHFNYE